ncbi:hypothetical protein, partial [Ralstonia sp. SET104]|uniref:hypothetical protein n=1 Tax=Ralstonia sp. SET104 TaxID=2448774 RepID=UPI001C8ABE05
VGVSIRNVAIQAHGIVRRTFFFAYTLRLHMASPDFSSLKALAVRPIKENATIGGAAFPCARRTKRASPRTDL